MKRIVICFKIRSFKFTFPPWFTLFIALTFRFTLEIKGYQTTQTQQTNKNSRVETGIRNELMRNGFTFIRWTQTDRVK